MRASRGYRPRSYPRSAPRPCRRRPMVTAHGADRLGTSRLGCLAAAAAVAEAAISAAATGATTAAAARRRARISCRCTRRAPCITCGGRRRARAGRGGHARCLRVDRAAPDDARGPRARAVLGAARRRAARVRDLRGCSWLCRVCARGGGGNSRVYVYTFARLCQPCPGNNLDQYVMGTVCTSVQPCPGDNLDLRYDYLLWLRSLFYINERLCGVSVRFLLTRMACTVNAMACVRGISCLCAVAHCCASRACLHWRYGTTIHAAVGCHRCARAHDTAEWWREYLRC